MTQPYYQKIIKLLIYVLAGIVALGTLLDSVGNAISLITPLIACIGTILIILCWLLINIILRFHPVTWVVGNNEVKLQKLGIKPMFFSIGMIVLLWIPSGLSLFQQKSFPSSENKEVNDSDNTSDPVFLNNIDKMNVSSEPPVGTYRVRYLQFNDDHRSFNALLEGKIQAAYPEIFIKEPFVMREDIFNLIKRLRSDINGYGFGLRSKTFNSSRIKRNFETDSNYIISHPDYYSDSEDLSSLDTDYAVGFLGAKNINNLAGSYERFSTLFLKLLKENPEIPDIAIEELYQNECDGQWFVWFLQRPLKIVILDIENISQQPLNINYIEGHFSHAPDFQLNAWSDDSEKSWETKRIEFPLRFLAPNEHLLIPMGLILTSFQPSPFTLKPETVPLELPESTLVLNRTTMVKMPKKVRPDNLHNDYFLGTFFIPHSVGGLGEIRPFLRTHIVYQGPDPMGSCPFVFLYSPANKDFVRSGTVISNLNGKENEGESSLRISPNTDGQILIKEIERETSYLDQIYLKAELMNGKQIIIHSDNAKLRFRDTDYFVMQRGQSIRLKFALPNEPIKNLFLMSSGYFVVDK